MTSRAAASTNAAHRAEDPDDLPQLPPTGWAVLGLLSFGRDLSGYDLKQWSDGIFRFFYISPAASQIYTELQRLERLELVTSRIVARDDVRGKRLFSITSSGRAALERWQAEVEPEPVMLKHGLMLRVWLGHLADRGRLRTLVESHRQRLTEELEAARSYEADAAIAPTSAYPELIGRWSRRRLEHELLLADEMLADLDHLPEP